jgi:hypothetical protein
MLAVDDTAVHCACHINVSDTAVQCAAESDFRIKKCFGSFVKIFNKVGCTAVSMKCAAESDCRINNSASDHSKDIQRWSYIVSMHVVYKARGAYVQGTHCTRDASYKGCLIQGTHHLASGETSSRDARFRDTMSVCKLWNM